MHTRPAEKLRPCHETMLSPAFLIKSPQPWFRYAQATRLVISNAPSGVCGGLTDRECTRSPGTDRRQRRGRHNRAVDRAAVAVVVAEGAEEGATEPRAEPDVPFAT